MKCFISYRRDDGAARPGRLHANLSAVFGKENVFMDTSSIAPGDSWPEELSNALDYAEIYIAVLGPNWLKVSDEHGKRRIDQESDWVRKELVAALNSGEEVIPVLVGGAHLPPEEALPTELQGLLKIQKLDIRDEYWDHDVELVISRIKSHSLKNTAADVKFSASRPYPVPPAHTPDFIGDEKLKLALTSVIQTWKLVITPLPEDVSKVRQEIHRTYEFDSFLDTIRFMDIVAPGCDIAMHHPRWENIFCTLSVYLTTWDIDHKISDRDIQLALYFDKAYADFGAADSALFARGRFL